MDIVKRDMLGHSISDIMKERSGLRVGTVGRTTWDDVNLYSNTFHDLLLEELRSNLKQVFGAPVLQKSRLLIKPVILLRKSHNVSHTDQKMFSAGPGDIWAEGL